MEKKAFKNFLYAYIWHGSYPYAIVVTVNKAYFVEPYGSIEAYNSLAELLKKTGIDLEDDMKYREDFEVTSNPEKVIKFCEKFDIEKALVSKMLKEEIGEHIPLRELSIDEVLEEWKLESSKPEPTAVSETEETEERDRRPSRNPRLKTSGGAGGGAS